MSFSLYVLIQGTCIDETGSVERRSVPTLYVNFNILTERHAASCACRIGPCSHGTPCRVEPNRTESNRTDYIWEKRGLRIFLLTAASRKALGPIQPPIQWVPGALSLGVKRPGRETDHSLSSTAEVKNAWSYNSTPQYLLPILKL
jgi:hypothetical protein